jgi:hypothetical protein
MGEGVRAEAVQEAPERASASPPPPHRPRRGRTHRSKMRRGYADKMRRPAEDKSQGWDLYGSAPA